MVADKLPRLQERRHVHILNPCAGDGRRCEEIRKHETGEDIRLTAAPGEAERMVQEEIAKDPYVHLMIYGGDGTVHEAVNGIMTSSGRDTASFSVIPAGSGNDFSTYVNGSGSFAKNQLTPLDVAKVTDGQGRVRYYANSLNLGFDGQVVREANRYKHQKGLRGSTAYLAGVAKVLLQKRAVPIQMELEGIQEIGSPHPSDSLSQDLSMDPLSQDKSMDPLSQDLSMDPLSQDKSKESPQGSLQFHRQGNKLCIAGEILLTACANGPYCGGGFKGAPLCSLQDGRLDVLVVRNITRRKFLSMVSAYHSGAYLQNGEVIPRFAPILRYFQCQKIHIQTEEPYCLDGELYGPAQSITVESIPHALWFSAL